MHDALKDMMRTLFRGLYYQIPFESVPQLILQCHILSSIEAGNIGIDATDIYVSLLATVASVSTTVVRLYLIYKENWSIAPVTTWLVWLLANGLDELRASGFYVPDWETQNFPARFTKATESVDDLKSKVQMFNSIITVLSDGGSTELCRRKLGDQLVASICGANPDECVVELDSADCDMRVTVRQGFGTCAGGLYDALACRSSSGAVILKVEGTSVTQRDITAWSLWIGLNPVELHIPNNKIDTVGCVTLARLVLNESLRYIDLTGNHIGDAGCLAIVQKLGRVQENTDGTQKSALICPDLRKIVMRYAGLTDKSVLPLIDLIANAAYRNSDRMLSISSGNRLSPETTAQQVQPTLHKIAGKLGLPQPTPEMVLRFARGLSRFARDSLGDSTAYAVWKCFDILPAEVSAVFLKAIAKDMKAFVVHDIANAGPACFPNDTAVALMGDCCRQMSKLVLLNMKNNTLTDRGAQSIGETFCVVAYRCLLLSGNNISDDGKGLLHGKWTAAGKPEADGVTLRGLYL